MTAGVKKGAPGRKYAKAFGAAVKRAKVARSLAETSVEPQLRPSRRSGDAGRDAPVRKEVD